MKPLIVAGFVLLAFAWISRGDDDFTVGIRIGLATAGATLLIIGGLGLIAGAGW